MVPFAQFKKRRKHPWRSVSFSKVSGLKHATLLKLTLLYRCFPCFLNCINGTKSRNAPHIEILLIGIRLGLRLSLTSALNKIIKLCNHASNNIATIL